MTGFDQIRRWFFGGTSAIPGRLFRTAVGLTLIITAIGWLVDGLEYLDPDALAPASPRGNDPALLSLVEHPAARLLTVVAMLAAGIGLSVGRAVRSSAILGWATVAATQAANDLLRNGGDNLLRMWTLLLVVFVFLTPHHDLEGPLFGRASWRRARRTVVSAWPARVVQLQMTVVYAVGGLTKLDAPDWLDGLAVSLITRLDRANRFWMPGVLEEVNPISQGLSYLILGTELVLPVVLWTRFRRWGVVAAILLHLAFGWGLKLHLITPVMLCGVMAFVEPEPAAEPAPRPVPA